MDTVTKPRTLTAPVDDLAARHQYLVDAADQTNGLAVIDTATLSKLVTTVIAHARTVDVWGRDDHLNLLEAGLLGTTA